LYFPAIAFLRCAPELQPWSERLAAAGKTKMAIVGAAMHKLIRIVYGVLSSGQLYDPEKLKPQKPAMAVP
ncbi:MAG: IS110 family transposase, partial [Nodosilinea sp.]